jgi:hypothetical protein
MLSKGYQGGTEKKIWYYPTDACVYPAIERTEGTIGSVA